MDNFTFENSNMKQYTVVLSTRNYTHLGEIGTIENVNIRKNLNSADEFSFVVKKYDVGAYKNNSLLSKENYRKALDNIWEQIVDLKLIWIKELNEYYEIQVSIEDSDDTTKTITATSLCEAELSQIETGNIEINTEQDILRDDYSITTFYNPTKPEASLLHRILDNAPHYHIEYVSPSLYNLQRTFTINNNIYNFMIGECSEQFNCLFLFNSATRGISAYDLLTTCNKCGKRGDFFDQCPDCGSKDLTYYGEDTTILINKKNLSDQISLTANTDELKNCFRLEAGDDVITATIRMLNPNGSDLYYQFSDNQLNDMSDELRTKLNEYDKKVASYNDTFKTLTLNIYETQDRIIEYQTGMMPHVENSEVNSKTEVEKLNNISLSSVGMPQVTSTTSLTTVNSSIKNYAKVLVKTGYVKIDIVQVENSEPTFSYSLTPDSDGWNYGIWRGRLKVTNYSDEEDVSITGYLNIRVHNDYEEYIRQKILKELQKEDDGECSIFEVLEIDEIEDFKKALTYYSLDRLTSFNDSIQSAMNVLIEMDHAHEGADLYEPLYLPYYNKLEACQKEMDVRQSQIDREQAKLDNYNKQREKIQAELNFKDFLGEYYNEFCSYKREQIYSNENYISDGLNNAEIIKKTEEFIETAKKELIKACDIQYTLSSSINNFYAIPAFKPLREKFKLGNWIRLEVDNKIYRLRLISYSYSWDAPENFDVEFSTYSRLKDIGYEARQVIQAVQNMSTSYGYVKQQANKGNNANTSIAEWKDKGLNNALIKIFNNENEEVSNTKHGILARSYDDITEQYSPKQLKITHNLLAFTDDAWKSSKQIVGEHNYVAYNNKTDSWEAKSGYGISSDFSQASHMSGCTIVGGEIISENYSYGLNEKEPTGTYINLNEGTFSFAGGKLRWNGKDLFIDSPDVVNQTQVVTINEDWLKKTDVYAENIKVNARNIKGNITADYVKAENIDISTSKIVNEQIQSLDCSKLTGTIKDSQISSLNASQITGTISDNILPSQMVNKNISGTFTGIIQPTDGITQDVTLENCTLTFVNGILTQVS